MFMVSSPASANVVCDTYTYGRDDDSAYPANLPFTLALGSTEYSNVFVSTNGTLTFGVADGTFGTYPQTPSVSVAGYDWVTFGEGTYLSFGSTENTFCAEWSVRPYPQSTGDLTQIRLVINRASDGGWHGEVVTFGWLPADLRRGIRYERGADVVPIEAAFDVNGGIPIEVPPAPVPSSFTEPPVVPTPEPTETVEPEPVPSIVPSLNPEPTPIPEPTQSESPSPEPVVTPSVTPEPTIEPSPTPIIVPEITQTPEPTPSPSQLDVVPVPEVPVASESPSESVIEPTTPIVEPTVEPEPEVTIEPVQEVVQESVQEVIDDAMSDGVLTDTERELVSDALVEEFLGEAITFEAFAESGLDYEDLPPEQPVMLENGVILTAEVADAIEIFEDTTELLNTLFTDPGKALKAISNIGADMTPQSRETSQNIVVSAIIVGQLAQIRRVK
jgi:hypothetical protein